MLENRGSTLIESLFAFEIFISILILYVSLIGVVFRCENQIQNEYKVILDKETQREWKDDFGAIVEMVLH